MAVEKLLGLDDTTIDTNHGNDTFVLSRFQAIKQGVMSEFRVKCTDAVNVKVAIYADNSGEPENLITANNTGQACAAGWNTLTIGDTNIVSGTYYWLAIIAETAGKVGADTDAGTMRYKAGTYSTWSFPNPAGEGFDSASCQTIEAGWGEPSIAILVSETMSMTEAKTIDQVFAATEIMTMTEQTLGWVKGIFITISDTIQMTESFAIKIWNWLTKHTTNWTQKSKNETSWTQKSKNTTNYNYKTKN